jgi:hypothetical protein
MQKPIPRQQPKMLTKEIKTNFMEYPVSIPGFEGQPITLKSAGFWKGAQLLVNGQPAPKGAKRGEMLLRANDGREVIAKFKQQFMDVPQLDIGGQTIKVVEPLKWYQWVWGGLPILLAFMGGAIGAVIGLLASGLNLSLFRSQFSPIVKYALVGLVSVAAVIVYIVLAGLFLSALNG